MLVTRLISITFSCESKCHTTIHMNITFRNLNTMVCIWNKCLIRININTT